MSKENIRNEAIDFFEKSKVEKFKDDMGIIDEGDIVSSEDLISDDESEEEHGDSI